MAARLLYRERDQVPADVQTVYDNVQKATGGVPNMFKESRVPHVSPGRCRSQDVVGKLKRLPK